MAVVFLCADLSGVHTFPATRFLIALEYCKCSYFLLPDHQKLSKVHFQFFFLLLSRSVKYASV